MAGNVQIYREGVWIAGPVEIARDFAARSRGLLGRDSIEGSAGMLIESCNSIHTFFMRFAIDAVFLSGEGRVLKVCGGVLPFRAAFSLFASKVLEMAAGAASAAGIVKGQVLEFREGRNGTGP